jgi:hypothetical protein
VDFVWTGPCIDATNLTIPDGSCPLYAPGQEETMCQLQTAATNTCLDIAGQSTDPGAPIIGKHAQSKRFLSLHYYLAVD